MDKKNFIPFPQRMRTELESLETQKMSIIKGFAYSLDISGNWAIAQDLSGIELVTAPPAPKITVQLPPNSDGPGHLI